MRSNWISRRDFLRISAGASLAGVLAACAPQATEQAPAEEPAEEGEPVAEAPAAEMVKIGCSTWGMPFEAALYTDFYIPRYEDENPNIEVEFFDFERYWDDIVRLQAGDEIPDVIRFAPSAVIWGYAGILTPLNELMDAVDYDKEAFFEPTWVGNTYEGQIYGVSQSPNFQGLHYDKDAFDEAGLPYPDHDYTIDRMMADAAALTRKDASGNVERYGFLGSWFAGNRHIASWLYAYGVRRPWDETGRNAEWDRPEVIEALTMMQRCVQEDLSPNNADRGGVGTMELFGQHKAAMFAEGTHCAPALTKNSPDLNFAITTWPKGTVKECGADDVGFGIAELSRHKAEAFDFLAYMLNRPNLIEYWQQLWVALPARKDTWTDPGLKQVKGIEDIVFGQEGGEEEFQAKSQWQIDAYDMDMVRFEFSHPLGSDISTIEAAVLDALTLKSGAISPQEAAAQLQEETQALFDDRFG
jgi:multiple sugar transport system substrate-binding protein